MTVRRRCGGEKSLKHKSLTPGDRTGAARKPFGIRAEYRMLQESPLARKRRLGGQAAAMFQASSPVPATRKGVGREGRMRAARHRVEGRSGNRGRGKAVGFRPERCAGRRGWGVEARKGIAPRPGDRNAKPDAARGMGGAGRRNQKARASPRRGQADRSPATGGRQQCRPPFCVRRPPRSVRSLEPCAGLTCFSLRNDAARAGMARRPGGSSVGEHVPRPCAILLHLLRQRLERIEARLRPQIVDQVDLD